MHPSKLIEWIIRPCIWSPSQFLRVVHLLLLSVAWISNESGLSLMWRNKHLHNCYQFRARVNSIVGCLLLKHFNINVILCSRANKLYLHLVKCLIQSVCKYFMQVLLVDQY